MAEATRGPRGDRRPGPGRVVRTVGRGVEPAGHVRRGAGRGLAISAPDALVHLLQYLLRPRSLLRIPACHSSVHTAVIRSSDLLLGAGTFFSVHLDYRGVRAQARKMQAKGTAEPRALKALWDEAHERSAAKGYACVVRLQGLWVKMAQVCRLSLNLS